MSDSEKALARDLLKLFRKHEPNFSLHLFQVGDDMLYFSWAQEGETTEVEVNNRLIVFRAVMKDPQEFAEKYLRAKKWKLCPPPSVRKT